MPGVVGRNKNILIQIGRGNISLAGRFHIHNPGYGGMDNLIGEQFGVVLEFAAVQLNDDAGFNQLVEQGFNHLTANFVGNSKFPRNLPEVISLEWIGREQRLHRFDKWVVFDLFYLLFFIFCHETDFMFVKV